VGAFNLSLILRKLLGAGTPRELKTMLERYFYGFCAFCWGWGWGRPFRGSR
jgi:hypothetical protein